VVRVRRVSDDPLLHVADLPGVAEAVHRARESVDALRGHRVLRRYAERVSAESALRGARASAALAGADVPLDVLRRTVAAGGRFPAPEEDVVQGALRVAGEVGQLTGVWSRAPLQALARLHSLAAAHQVPDDELGRPAPVAATRLAALTQLLTAPTTAPALVVAAVAHAEIETSGAFAVGAGQVARAAYRLTIVARGLDPAALSVPEVGHLELGREAYDDALTGYRDGGPDGVAAWVVHCAEATVLGAREGVAVCEAIQRG
jgi:hypothetical protein